MFFNEKLKEIVGEPGARAPLVVADPFSLDSLIAWLEKQRGETVYCYMDAGDCLIHRYFKAVGVSCQTVSSQTYTDEHWRNHPIPRGFKEASQGHASESNRWVFSSALSRARALRDTP